MKLLLLNYFDSGGGAAIAAERLLIALRQYGIDVVFGVIEKTKNNNYVILLNKSSFFDRYRRLRIIKQ